MAFARISLLAMAATALACLLAATASPVPPPPPKPTIITRCTANNTVAVTFDDGPSDYTPTLLDYLKTKNIKVTFFLNGNTYHNILTEPYTSIIQRADAEGHQIAHHTLTHLDLTQPTTDWANEIDTMTLMLKKIIYKRPVYLRPPYGAVDDHVMAYLTAKGFKVVTWNLDTNDWKGDEDASFQAYVDALSAPDFASKGFIGLEHDAYYGTVNTLAPRVIEYILSLGLKITTVAECVGDKYNWYEW